jgi:hypothetical protein
MQNRRSHSEKRNQPAGTTGSAKPGY